MTFQRIKALRWGTVVLLLLVGALWRAPALASSGWIDLGFLPGTWIAARVHGVSADGTVAAGYLDDDTGKHRAFRWTQTGGMVDLGTLGGYSVWGSLAWGMSADGKVVVGDAEASNGRDYAFRWTQASAALYP